MAEQNARIGKRHAARSVHVTAATFQQRRAANGACVIRPLRDHQRQYDFIDTLPECRQQNQRNQDRREAELDIDNTHDQRVRFATNVSADQPQCCANGQRNHRAGDTHQQTGSRAVQNRAQQIAPLIVGAQPVNHATHTGGARFQAAIHDVELR